MTRSGIAFVLVTIGGSLCVADAQEPLYVPGEHDYLTADLRERVEALKRDAATTARSRDEIEGRARVLWSWGNAFAMAGGHLHENLPFIVTQGMQGGRTFLFVQQLPMLVRDLDLKERLPQALGTTTLEPRGPFPSGSYQTLRQTFTVGSIDWKEGGHIFLGREISTDYGSYQTTDPTAENFVTISSDRPAAKFEEVSSVLIGPKAQLLGTGSLKAFRLTGATLVQGDTVTIVYGDPSGGSLGFRVPSFESDVLYLPIYIDFDGTEHYLSPSLQSYSTHGGSVSSVAVFAPSVISAGAAFEITVRAQDDYSNRATGAIPGYELSVDGRMVRTVPSGGAAVQQIRDLRIDNPGVYRIAAVPDEDVPPARSNPILVKASPKHSIYWGDTHAHIRYGEGLGSITHFFRHAREDSRLDYVSLTEHDIFLDDFEWSTLVQAAIDYFEPGKFITFLGYEWTAGLEGGGHHNVLFRDVTDRDRVPIQEAATIDDLYTGLRRENDSRDVVTIPHAHMPGNWKVSDAALERVVEITSMHGSFEWFGNNYLQQGHEVGFVGASDDHRARPGVSGTTPGGLEQRGGLGAVLATDKSRDAIFAGLRDRATYATTGERIVLDLRANDTLMGGRLLVESRVAIRGNVHGTAPIETIAIIKNGQVVWEDNYVATSLTSSCAVLLTFDSEANPMTYDVPRGTRPWIGTIDVRGATLKHLESIGIDNVYNEFADISQDATNTIDFQCYTRGRPNSLLLHLADASDRTEIEISLEAMPEGVRLLSTTGLRQYPAATIRLPFSALENGIITYDSSMDAFTDTVRATVIKPEASLDRTVDYEDTTAIEGDYYYVRVRQIDGAVAWSSPWWVGAPGQ